MRIVFLTGIWPPDVGGPATHGPDFARFLRDRGHDVRVVTMGDHPPSDLPVPVESISRSRPFPVRYSQIALSGARLARSADVIYATATYAAAAAASIAAARPLLVKLVSDPAYERARRYGLFRGSLEDFQATTESRVRLLKALRSQSLRRARQIVVPSRYLAEIAAGWGLGATQIEVLLNPAPVVVDIDPHELEAGTFVFVGRLTAQKALPVALDALARTPGTRLLLVGDGPERSALEEQAQRLGVLGRVRFVGSVSRDETLRYVAGGLASILPSAWENLPHSAVEALAVGAPVVATAVGGVPEVVLDEENGLLVPPNDAQALSVAMGRLLHDGALRARLASRAAASVEAISRDAIYGRLEAILARVAA
ncbi:MAG: glycosyltransferase family 4 protein [Actinobacteria bacterium]|nr:glycosyltransferase family 4 protein [Actinomycetota bacterium]